MRCSGIAGYTILSVFLFWGVAGHVSGGQGLRPHPYLFCTPANVSALKEKIRQDPVFTRAWDKMRADADKFAADKNAGLNRVEVLGLVYQVTGTDQYAQAARRILLKESENKAWGDPMLLSRTPPWNAGLGEAGKCYDMAVGFDSIYPMLSPADRKTIAAALVRLGILPTLNDWLMGDRRIHTLDTMGHNWWSACVFMAGIASMAVMNEEPQAREWLDKISQGSVEWFDFAGSVLQNKPASFDAAGGFYESVNYAAFAMSEYLLFRLAWLNAMEQEPPQISMLDKIGDFFIHSCYPNSGALMSVNFGDTSLHAHGGRPMLLLMACGDQRDRYLWYLSQIQQGQFREGADINTPTGLLLWPSIDVEKAAEKQPDLPHSILLKDMGWAMMRSSWEKDATMLAVKSGFTWNHAHADAGSFILFHHGQYMLIDSGNCSYALPEYTDYYCQSQAHNVVLFNGKGQDPEDDYYGVKNPGHLYNLMDAGSFKYVWADATGPYAQNFSRNFRHFIWIDDVILIVDDLKTHTPGQFEWLLHYDGKIQRKGLDLHVTKEDAQVRVRPLFPDTFPDGGFAHDFPEKMQMAERTGLKDHDPKTQMDYYAFLAPETTRRMKFVTAIFLDAEAESSTRLERLEGKDMIGVRIRKADKITDIYFNLLADGRIKHRNSNNVFNGWETDALMIGATYAEGQVAADTLQRVFVSHGSYLRSNGTTLVDSLSKVFMVSEETGEGLNVILQGQPHINLTLYAGQVPKNVKVNDQPVEPKYEAETEKLQIRL
ncbi:MAG: heparinase II/III family protein [Planctomycetaceae bacterium]|nr:heparinase II/III family protein [Planctomycetaceae bacterium]